MLSPSLRRTVPDRLGRRYRMPEPAELAGLVVLLSSIALPAYGLASLLVEVLP